VNDVAVSARMTTLDGAGGPLAVYEARPTEPFPSPSGVVLLHEAFGVTDHVTDVARRLAALGHHVVAPDLFHRSGTGTVAPYGDLQAAVPFFQSLTGDDDLLDDADAALDHLRRQGVPDARIGVLGFCFGGRVSFLVGARRGLGAAVTFYGGGIMKANPFLPFPALVDDAPTMRTPWLGLYGAEDHGIPADEVDALERETAQASVETRLVRYAGAGHAFHNDVLPSFDEAAATAAWSEAVGWLASHGVRPG
jgi:carboxymethylenebutenolidase